MTHGRDFRRTSGATAHRRRPGVALAALWIGIVALVLGVLLVVPYLVRGPLVVLPIAVVVLAGVGVGLAVRARRHAAPAPAASGAMASAVVALLGGAVLLAVFFTSLASLGVDHVEARGQGPKNITAVFSSDGQSREFTWDGDGFAQVATKGPWAEVTVTAPADSADQNVSCQLEWNDELVVEKSGSGSVTCRYDRG